MKKIKTEKKPFFSKLLEAQKVNQTDELKGGGPVYVTMKYPSDNDDYGDITF